MFPKCVTRHSVIVKMSSLIFCGHLFCHRMFHPAINKMYPSFTIHYIMFVRVLRELIAYKILVEC